MTGSRQQTPTDRLEEIRREHADMGRIERERYAGDFVWELLEIALAQRDVVVAAQVLLEEADKHREDVWCGDYDRARDELRAAVAAVVSGTPERPTRFCGVCGHPSVSAYAGGWKCRDCGAVVSGTPPPEEQT
jgi:NADH pyrophosphatase NudC (nudix superfamily)